MRDLAYEIKEQTKGYYVVTEMPPADAEGGCNEFDQQVARLRSQGHEIPYHCRSQVTTVKENEHGWTESCCVGGQDW
jgi:hypothetical protein